jgi:hypothetical protein
MSDKPEKKKATKKNKDTSSLSSTTSSFSIVTEKLDSSNETVVKSEKAETGDKVTISIIIVEKGGSLKELTIKDYVEADLYKKCGFKKPDGFKKETEWATKVDGKKHVVSVYGKTDGKANMENKYDFPPPVDNTLFFGSCALVASLKQDDGQLVLTNLSQPLWLKIYEKLFGGFEDLAATCQEDEEEEDELDNVPASKKTKNGYLKDGFVVDSDGDEDDYDNSSLEESESLDDTDETSEGVLVLEDIGSELSEEEYEDEDDDNNTPTNK